MTSIRTLFKRLVRFVLLPLGVIVVIGVLGGLLTRSFIQSNIEERRNITSPNGVETLETVTIGGIKQWIQVRGNDRDNPIILYLHGGPGSAMTPAGHAFQTGWEEDFTMVHWDQRGAGRTHRTNGSASTDGVTLDRMVEDAHEVTLYLRKRFGKDRIFLLGHSWGSYLGIRLIKQYPELFHAYVGTGQAVDFQEGLELSRQAALSLAREQDNAEGVRELEALGPPPYSADELGILGPWMTKLSGGFYRETWLVIKSHLIAPGESLNDIRYRFDRSRRPEGIKRLVEALMKEKLNDLGYGFEVPVFFFLGRHDYFTPSALAEAYLNAIKAPLEELVWFEKSGHAPMISQPEEFGRALIERMLPLAAQGEEEDSEVHQETIGANNMKIEGLDHVAIGVRDMDKAVEWFTRVLGTEFYDIVGASDLSAEELGARYMLSLDHGVELISPVLPIKETTAPHIKRLAKLLEGRDSVIMRIAFKAEGLSEDAFKEKGVGIEWKIETDEVKPLPLSNIKEYLAKEEDTLGIQMMFVDFDQPQE